VISLFVSTLLANKITYVIGEWIGVILDEPKGKNNGNVQKKGLHIKACLHVAQS
jgi:dynactin complex subunit